MEEMKQSADGTYVVKNKKKVNILAFIGCFVLAFIIWIYVMNVKMYDNTKTFSIKMDIKGESSLLNDKSFSIFGASETLVKVTVQGSNADIQKYSEKDFRVYIDVTNIEKKGVNYLNVVVETPSAAIAVISTDPVQTTVYVDEKVSNVKIPISTVNEEGQVLSSNKYDINLSELNVGGPKTYVDEISYVQIAVDTSKYIDMDQKLHAVSYIHFYNEAGQLLNLPYLIYDSSTITVKEKAQNSITADEVSNISDDTNLG
jgi:YbbR domain-containing protein